MKTEVFFVMCCILQLSSAAFANTADCTNPKPLGMENGDILNAHITASSEYDANHGATNGRLNFYAGGVKTGAWSAGANDVNQWLKVDLRFLRTTVTQIETQGRANCTCNQWVTSYTLSYSVDDVTYVNYQQNGLVKVFSGNSDGDSIVRHVLSPAIVARYIRVHPKTFNSYISMRVEFVGCSLKELDSPSCQFIKAKGLCTELDVQALCPTDCPPSCSNYIPDAGCTKVNNNGQCPTLFPLCRKTCLKCARLFVSLGCFIDKNQDRIMPTFLHQDFADANIVSVCAQKAADRGFSVFGVEATGQCFSGVNTEISHKKHGKAPDADCPTGTGASFRMSVYEFE